MRSLAALVLFVFYASSAAAHELRPAFLQMTEIARGEFDVLWKVPARGELRLALYVVLPEACSETSPKTASDAGSAIASRWRVQCRGSLAGQVVTVDGLSATFTDALARVEWVDGTVQTARMTPDAPRFTITTAPTALETAGTYFALGVEHILLGVDHLLFVLALLLLIRSVRTLVATITAFTVAHSITLTAAALGLTRVPQPPIEAAIALSIAVIAAEIVRAERGETDLSIRYPWAIAFVFGLLHGFGFGGALRDIGLPQKDVPLALLTFNLGVEAGQLLFVTAVLLVAIAIRRLSAMYGELMRRVAGYAIGCVAAFWFAERVASFVS